jgi:hypothetical protein
MPRFDERWRDNAATYVCFRGTENKKKKKKKRRRRKKGRKEKVEEAKRTIVRRKCE